MKNYSVYLINGEIIKAKATDERQAELSIPDDKYNEGIFMTVPGEKQEFIFESETSMWKPNPDFYPIMEISGKLYGNFGSVEPLYFSNGGILPGVVEERAKELLPILVEGTMFQNGDTNLLIEFNERTMSHILVWEELYNSGKIDYVFVSLKTWLVMMANAYIAKDNPFRVATVQADKISLYKRYM